MASEIRNRFTDTEMQIARETDLPELLSHLGYQVKRVGRFHTTAEMDSLRIKDRRKWFRYSQNTGGDAITFLQQFCGKSFPEAVEYLLTFHGKARDAPIPQPKPISPKQEFSLPPRNADDRRVFAYLRKRDIAAQVIRQFLNAGLLYEDAVHHNCVFVGMDGDIAKHAHLRSTNSEGKVFRMNVEGSESAHSFHKDGTDKSLYVFEAPIDLLSHITLYPYGWQEHSYVACCGTSAQPVLERLRQNPRLDTVYLCLDNDDAGNDACERMTETLEEMNLEVQRLCPQRKDWNDDLCAKFEKKEKAT